MIDLIISEPSSFLSTGTYGTDWGYSEEALPLQVPLDVQLETPVNLEKPESLNEFYQENHYELFGSARPYLPPNVTKMLRKWVTRPITNKQAIKVMKDIAEIAIDFYDIQEGKYVAIGLDGRVVESANSSFDLLMKIQGRQLSIKTFVWHVGSDAIAGWDV